MGLLERFCKWYLEKNNWAVCSKLFFDAVCKSAGWEDVKDIGRCDSSFCGYGKYFGIRWIKTQQGENK